MAVGEPSNTKEAVKTEPLELSTYSKLNTAKAMLYQVNIFNLCMTVP